MQRDAKVQEPKYKMKQNQLFLVSNLHRTKSQSLHEPPNHQLENYPQSFDVQTLRALAVLHQSPDVPERRRPQTTYQDEFGLPAPLCPQ